MPPYAPKQKHKRTKKRKIINTKRLCKLSAKITTQDNQKALHKPFTRLKSASKSIQLKIKERKSFVRFLVMQVLHFLSFCQA